jgi:hypothetical protein
VERLKAKESCMNVELSEKDKDTENKERREEYNRKYERYMTEEIPGGRERECKRKKNDGEI